MPSASLAALRRALVVLSVLGALFGAAPGVPACEGRTADSAVVSVALEPSDEGAQDAAEAVLPVQPGRPARLIRPPATDVVRAEPLSPPAVSYDNARRPAAETGVRCVVLRC
uniref:Secreted protein n=1 Tax=Streptomyces sp. NBC_00003 TaxID=2903608 RepID=A0AAU2UZB0_9ACTN